MKKILSIILIIITIIPVMSATYIPATAAQKTVLITAYSWNRIGDGDKPSSPCSEITLHFKKLKDIHRYRYYYKLWDMSNNQTYGWTKSGEVMYSGSGTDNKSVTVNIDDSVISGLNMKGYYLNNQSFGSASWYRKDLRIYVTVRGLSDNGKSFTTDFERNCYFECSKGDFVTTTITGWGSASQGRCVGIYSPSFSFVKSSVAGVRLYWKTKSNNSKGYIWSHKDTPISKFYGHTDSAGYSTSDIRINSSDCNKMVVDKDGDICLSARLINSKGNPISPDINQYWNYEKFINGR